MATQTAKDVLKYAKENKVEAVDLKFLDFLGTWQHFSIPTSELSEDLFEEGIGFDGSSIRGWQPINASDMLVIPDPATAVIDPFMALPTLSLICNIVDPITKESYSRDPRNIARKADAYLKSTGIGDVAYFGPEPEFFVFDEVRYEQNQHTGFYIIDSAEGQWNTGRKTDPVNDRSGKLVEGLNLGYKPRYKEGYFPVAPTDTQQDIRAEMVREMEKVGIRVEKHHHEVATAGQAEIDMRFLSLVQMGDALMWYKYIVKNVARRYDKTATFMPKPIFGDNGSGMHVHQSIWKGEKPLFAGDRYGGMSELGMHYIGGILKHAPALAAFTNPDDELLPPPGAGLRGADQPRVLEPQPLGRGAHPDVLAVAEGEAHRGALPGPVVQPLHGVRGDADGGPRRHRAPARPGPAARQGHLRAHARGAEGRSDDAGQRSTRRSAT